MAKIILYSYSCDLDAYRNSAFELAIELPCDVNAALSKKVEEISNLDAIISDFSTSFDLLMSSRELMIFSRLEYALSNTGQQVYRATLEIDGIQMIDGQLYVNKTSERIIDGIVSYTVQMIGTHQTWKEDFKNSTFSDLELGSVEWTKANIENLWQNNDSYVDGGDTIYPLLANFGEWFGDKFGLAYSATVLDIRFLVYKLAILQAMYCKAGYKVRSEFLNSNVFRKQADYLLKQDFGLEESTLSGAETIVTLSVDNPLGIFPVQFDTIVIDNSNRWDLINWEYVNNSGNFLDEVFIDLDATICNSDAGLHKCGLVLFVYAITPGGSVLPGTGYYEIPEFNFLTSSGSAGLAGNTCFSASATVNVSQVLRDALVNNGYLEIGWRIQIVHLEETVGPVFTYTQAGARLRVYTQAGNHFQYNDNIQISQVLADSFSLYDWLLDNKTLYNLRFRTIESEKIVEIEPYPSSYQTYPTLSVASYNAKGFIGNINNPRDIIDITNHIDVCKFIEKDFPNVQQTEYFFFKFKDSSDKYNRYLNFPNDTNPLFSNDTSPDGVGAKKTEIKLKIYEPVLNDYDQRISNASGFRTYIPFMWEFAREQTASVNPEQGTLLGVRTFCVIGWETQVSQVGDQLDAIGFIFEGTTWQFVPNVGQVFEANIVLTPSAYGIIEQNNVFGDNLSLVPQTKNHVNTYYSFETSNQQNAIEFELDLLADNLFFYQMNPRKLIRIFSEQSSLMRFNGNYIWQQITKQMTDNKAIIVLKPILPCR